MRPVAISVCVDYADILEDTIPTWKEWFDKVIIVTTEFDTDTIEVAEMNGAIPFITDVFYDYGATFNKGAALNMGLGLARNLDPPFRAIVDADIMLPEYNDDRWASLSAGMLYCAPRRVLPCIGAYTLDLDWSILPLHDEHGEFPGYLQVFHGQDTRGRTYPDTWAHAGGCDSEFYMRWNPCTAWLPFEVLHMGPLATNWCGRATPLKDGSIPDQADARKGLLKGYLEERWRTKSNSHEKVNP